MLWADHDLRIRRHAAQIFTMPTASPQASRGACQRVSCAPSKRNARRPRPPPVGAAGNSRWLRLAGAFRVTRLPCADKLIHGVQLPGSQVGAEKEIMMGGGLPSATMKILGITHPASDW